jgi:hypothetical protein
MSAITATKANQASPIPAAISRMNMTNTLPDGEKGNHAMPATQPEQFGNP